MRNACLMMERILWPWPAVCVRALACADTAAIQKYSRALQLWDTSCLDASAGRLGAPTEVKCYFLNAIGQVYQSAEGRAEETLAAFVDAKRQGARLPDDHPERALALSNTAGAYYELGELGLARELWSAAAEIRTQTLGEGHPDVALCKNNLACCLCRMGSDNVTQATALLNQAYESLFEGLGAEHPRTFTVYRNLTRVKQLRGNLRPSVLTLPKAGGLASLGGRAPAAKKTDKGKTGERNAAAMAAMTAALPLLCRHCC